MLGLDGMKDDVSEDIQALADEGCWTWDENAPSAGDDRVWGKHSSSLFRAFAQGLKAPAPWMNRARRATQQRARRSASGSDSVRPGPSAGITAPGNSLRTGDPGARSANHGTTAPRCFPWLQEGGFPGGLSDVRPDRGGEFGRGTVGGFLWVIPLDRLP